MLYMLNHMIICNNMCHVYFFRAKSLSFTATLNFSGTARREDLKDRRLRSEPRTARARDVAVTGDAPGARDDVGDRSLDASNLESKSSNIQL